MADDLPPGFTVDRRDELPPGFKPDALPTGTQTGSIVRGIPIVGPLLDKGIAAIGAAPAAVLPGEGYAAMYNKMIGGQDRYEAEHPAAAAIGNIAGSTLATVPVARAFPKVFGGAGMPGQIVAGGAIGGTDAAIRSGGDPTATAIGGTIGAAGPIMGSVLAPVGQGIAAGTRAIAERTPGIRSVLAPKIVPPPNAEVFNAATNGFDTLSRGGVTYTPQALGDVNTLIKNDLYNMSKGTARSASETHAILDDIKNLPPNPTTLHRARLQLQDVINNAGAGSPEGQSAIHAKGIIENFLEAPPPNAIASGQFDAATVGARLKDANANYRAAMTDQALRDRVAKGLVDSSNQAVPFLAEGARTRQAVASLRKDPNQTKFMLPNEEAALADVNRSGSIGETLMRAASGATGSGRFNPLTAVTPLLTAGGGLVATGAGIPAAVVAGGTLAGGLASSAATTGLTRKAVENASNVIRSNAPYAQAQMRSQVYQPAIPGSPYTPPAPSIGARDYRNEMARLLALQAERSTVEP